MRDAFWTKDWPVALAYSLFFLILASVLLPAPFRALEYRLYDAGLRAQARTPSDRVVIVAIDDDSLARLGPLPWPRSVHAELIDQLRAASAHTVASTLFYPESREEPGLRAVSELADALAQSPIVRTVPGEISLLQQRVADAEALRQRLAQARPPIPDLAILRALQQAWSQSMLATRYAAELVALRERLEQARQALSADDMLAPALQRQGAVLLALQPGADVNGAVLPDAALRYALRAPGAAAATTVPGRSAPRLPPPELAAAAAGIGALAYTPDEDGVLRRESLLLRQGESGLPSLALLTAARAMGLAPEALRLRAGRLWLGNAALRTGPDLKLRTHFYADAAGRAPFPVFGFAAVGAGTVPTAALRDKVVLIGATGANESTLRSPVSAHTPPVTMLAHSVSTLLKGHAITTPSWVPGLRALTAVLAVAYLALAVPLLGPALGLAVSLGLAALLLLGEFYLLSVGSLWVPLLVPALLIASGHLLMWAHRRLSPRPAAPAAGKPPARAATLDADATADVDAERPPERLRLGRYVLERELGRGAMGKVYLGRDPRIGRQVAIKTLALSADFASDDLAAVKARFFREAEAAGSLSHPHIVQIFDVGEDHDLAYIAMEFIQGQDLMRHTRPGGLLPVAEVLGHVADAAEALDYAHQRNTVHRDIKPANLMRVEATQTIKVTDFGVARVTDASKTRTGMVLGTPSYMSPEQLSGKKVDGRSDLFSLGVTLYQLLTGRLPFQAESLAGLMYKIANDTPPAPSSVRPELPVALDAIMDKALQKRVESRYARGGDFARDLRAVLATLT